MKDDVGLPDLADKVVLGRIAHCILEVTHPEELPEETFSDDDMVEDEFIDTDAIVNSNPASAADYDNLRRLIAEGLDAQKKLYCLQTFLLTTMHPDPPSDATADVRDDSTLFQFGTGEPHPSSTPLSQLMEMTPEEQEQHYCKLLNATERHKHQNYCGVPNPEDLTPEEAQEKCRFKYFMDLLGKPRLVVKQSFVKTKGGGKHSKLTMDLKSQRYDQWLNSHISWSAGWPTLTSGSQWMWERLLAT